MTWNGRLVVDVDQLYRVKESERRSSKENSSSMYTLYSFTNMYLSSIQKGIQTTHAAAKLPSKYAMCSNYSRIISDWAMEHQRMAVLNGGEHNRLGEILKELGRANYPYAAFRESGLNDALTAVAIILPDEKFDSSVRAKLKKDNGIDGYLARLLMESERAI